LAVVENAYGDAREEELEKYISMSKKAKETSSELSVKEST
jgi:hypothetical protein